MRLCDVRDGAAREGLAARTPSPRPQNKLVIRSLHASPQVYFFFSSASSFIFFRMPAKRFSVHVARWAS